MIYTDAYIQREFSGKKWALPAMVYGRPLELYEGAPIGQQRVIKELEALGYRPLSHDRRPGTYVVRDQRLQVHTRGFRFWDGSEPERRLQIDFRGNRVSQIGDRSGSDSAIVRLEPLHIGGIYPKHNEDRMLVRLDEVPPFFIDALIAVEDQDYFDHHGVSLIGIARAMWANVRAGGVAQGGSTLTQQLVKNFFLTRERTVTRKLTEILMAVMLDLRYSKEDILEAYLNEIYLGQDGHRAIHGIGLASQYYFNRPLGELDGNQMALMVAMIKGPSYYDPWRHPERALARRNLVLQKTQEQGRLSPDIADRLSTLPLSMGERGRARSRFYPAYLDLVRRQLRSDYSEDDLASEGLQVFTGLDPVVQQAAESALTTTLDRIEQQQQAAGRDVRGLQGAVVVTRVDSGEVLALVGGRESRFAGFNRALDAARPVGSLMKPAVYLSALERGDYTLMTALDDSPVQYTARNGTVWAPRNYDRESHGQVRFYEALAKSYNQSTARLGLDIGVGQVSETIQRLGYSGAVPQLPSVFLGALALSPLDVAGLYQTIASGGFVTPLRAIREVLDNQTRPLLRYDVDVEQRVDDRAVYLLDYALRAVMTEGTGRGVRRYLPASFTVAGKTGTTDEQRDVWFAGYSGDLLAVVWVGMDNNVQTPLTGSSGALPVWGALMAEVSQVPLPNRLPDGVVELWVDAAAGGLSSAGCDGARLIPFVAGTQPAYRSGCSDAAVSIEPRPAPARPPPPPKPPPQQDRSFWERLFSR